MDKSKSIRKKEESLEQKQIHYLLPLSKFYRGLGSMKQSKKRRNFFDYLQTTKEKIGYEQKLRKKLDDLC